MKALLLHGMEDTKKMTKSLIDGSIFFSVEPLPNDDYRISVKPDVAHVVDDIRKRLKIQGAWEL
jgi:hypothetical protein